MRAILSVYEKAGLEAFARGLADLGIEIFSTGNTLRALEQAQVPAQSITDLTAFPEILDGRVKTLHPAIHGGLLARRDKPEHMQQLEQLGIAPIDLVVSNLYPFIETVAGRAVELETALETIDIGGPTLIRASAKNFPSVLTVVDPADYEQVLELLRAGAIPLAERRRLAQKAFQHVASYDTAVAEYLLDPAEQYPEQLTLAFERVMPLHYGENPHQRAAFYSQTSIRFTTPLGLAGAEQLHGPELSFNNILDADAAWNAANDFDEPTAVVVKHTNPIGLSSNPNLTEAYRRAYAADTVSAYGGIVAFNRRVDDATAAATRGVLYNIMIAPDYDDVALQRLRTRRSLRVLKMAPPHPSGEGRGEGNAERGRSELEYRYVYGGLLVQTRDRGTDRDVPFRTVTKRAPTEAELAELRFAWQVVKHIKSNAIVLTANRSLAGMGAGQPNRVTSVMLAVRQAGESARGSVLASDAFFPFEDGVQAAAEAGVTAIAQPGGSLRDQECIDAADRAGMAMVFSGMRHFRH